MLRNSARYTKWVAWQQIRVFTFSNVVMCEQYHRNKLNPFLLGLISSRTSLRGHQGHKMDREFFYLTLMRSKFDLDLQMIMIFYEISSFGLDPMKKPRYGLNISVDWKWSQGLFTSTDTEIRPEIQSVFNIGPMVMGTLTASKGVEPI